MIFVGIAAMFIFLKLLAELPFSGPRINVLCGEEFLNPLTHFSSQIKSLVACRTCCKDRRDAIENLYKSPFQFLSHALPITVLRVVFFALKVRIVLEMVRLRDFYLKRVPDLLEGLQLNLDLTAFHLEILRVHQG